MMTSNVAQGLLNDRRIALTAGGFARTDSDRDDVNSDRDDDNSDRDDDDADFDVDGPATMPGTTDPPAGSSASVVIGHSSPDAAS
jgi:hypothetical protein